MMVLRAFFTLAAAAFFSLAQADDQNPVKAIVSVAPSQAAPGAKAELKIDLQIDPDFHAFEDMMQVKWDGLEVKPLSVSPLKPFTEKDTGRTRNVAEGEAVVIASIQIPNDLSEGVHHAKVSFRYQACKGTTLCLLPKTLLLDTPYTVSKAGQNRSVATKPDSVSLTTFEGALARGTFLAFVFVFIGGVLTSFTPCVFPMIPITISIIGARSAQNKKSRAFFLSLSYVLGIAVTYATLGVVAASTGAFFGSALSNFWIVAFIAAVFFIMGLSLLGLFQLQVPAFVRNKLGNANTGSGAGGAFVAGLFAGIVASPCVGPVLVSILAYVARTANVTLGFFLLFTFAMGIGVLFIVLGTFSGLLTKLPKAGPWLKRVEMTFGAILIGMAFFYASPLLPKMSTKAKPGLAWETFSSSLYGKYLGEHRAVIVDFGADWCAACHELDEKTYTDASVMSTGKNFALLKIDATKQDDEVSKLQKQFNVLGLPTVIFVDKTGKVHDDLTVTGFVEPNVFVEKMKKTLD